LRIASFCRRRPGTLIGYLTLLCGLGKRLFTTPFSTDILQKVRLGRDAVQERKKTLKIPLHAKITYKEISIMSTEEEIALHLA
jgi:hypothetical protein